MANRRVNKKQWNFWRRLKRLIRVTFTAVCTIAFFVGIVLLVNWYHDYKDSNIVRELKAEETVLDGITLNNGVRIRADLLTPNPYSRSQKKLRQVNSIVIHYVGNPGTSAKNNRDYFEGLGSSGATSASSNFVVGLKGEVIQCIPVNEVAYCSNHRNSDTLSIEVCHPDANGKFKKATYRSVVELTAYLCHMFNLTSEDVIRHYDVTGKLCPLYYVNNPDKWDKLKQDVDKAMEQYE